MTSAVPSMDATSPATMPATTRTPLMIRAAWHPMFIGFADAGITVAPCHVGMLISVQHWAGRSNRGHGRPGGVGRVRVVAPVRGHQVGPGQGGIGAARDDAAGRARRRARAGRGTWWTR